MLDQNVRSKTVAVDVSVLNPSPQTLSDISISDEVSAGSGLFELEVCN